MHEIFQHCSLLQRKPMVSQWFGALQICETPGVVCFEVSTAVETTSPRTPSPCPSLSAPVCLRPRLFRLHCSGSWGSTTLKTHNFVTNFGTQSIQRGCHLANQTAVNSPYPCVSSKNMRGDMVSIGISWYQLLAVSRCIPHITSKISPLRSWRIFVACPGAGHL